MDLKAEEFFQRIVSEEARREPLDSVNVKELESKLPPWYDEKRYKRGQDFFNKYFFGFIASYNIGLMAVLAIPSALKIVIGTNKSNSQRTAYRRYWSTFRHIVSWGQYDLKPGSVSWRSLHTVRSRHLKAGKEAVLKGHGTFSQRDVAFTLFGFIGFPYLKPDKFGIFQTEEEEWDSYNHFWGVNAYMLGLQDRYNMCVRPFDETRRICQLLLDRVFTPCLANPPEYFEHMAYVAIAGVADFYPAAEPQSSVYITKQLSSVPGYIQMESERIELKGKLLELTNGRHDIGVPTSKLLEKCAIEGLPTQDHLLYPSDYNSITSIPVYNHLTNFAKYKLASANILIAFYCTNIGRLVLNFYMTWTIFLATYFPYIVILKYGFKDAYSNMFKDDPRDGAVPKPNSEYLKPAPPEPWYKIMFDIMF